MSQSALRKPHDHEEFYVELVGSYAAGEHVSRGVGPSERAAADEAERRWRLSFAGERPIRKIVILRTRRQS